MSVNWWLGEQNAVYLYGGILGSNKNTVPIHAEIWMNFEKFMLSEISQTREDHLLHNSIYMKCPEKANV